MDKKIDTIIDENKTKPLFIAKDHVATLESMFPDFSEVCHQTLQMSRARKEYVAAPRAVLTDALDIYTIDSDDGGITAQHRGVLKEKISGNGIEVFSTLEVDAAHFVAHVVPYKLSGRFYLGKTRVLTPARTARIMKAARERHQENSAIKYTVEVSTADSKFLDQSKIDEIFRKSEVTCTPSTSTASDASIAMGKIIEKTVEQEYSNDSKNSSPSLLRDCLLSESAAIEYLQPYQETAKISEVNTQDENGK